LSLDRYSVGDLFGRPADGAGGRLTDEATRALDDSRFTAARIGQQRRAAYAIGPALAPAICFWWPVIGARSFLTKRKCGRKGLWIRFDGCSGAFNHIVKATQFDSSFSWA
jgi:hypothetical protein